MSAARSMLVAFLDAHAQLALVEVREALGSTPREAGAWMLVSPTASLGTIGGGQLEFLAIDKARHLLAANVESGALSVPLGPEIGQCCGGRVEVAIAILSDTSRAELLERIQAEDGAQPAVYLFGGGHVGHALAAALTLLPIRVTVVETRQEALDGLVEAATQLLTPVPEQVVRSAPPRSAFVVLTHDHALDFLIVAEALKRRDAAYVGMIGSKTKRATFRSWYLRETAGEPADLERLVSPIGGNALHDKRPAVIAALAAAEIAAAVLE